MEPSAPSFIQEPPLGARDRQLGALALLGGLLLLPSCLMIEFGIWGGNPFIDDEDDEVVVCEAVRQCCLEQIVEGVDYERCIVEALRNSGPCAHAVSDAGPGGSN